MPDRAQPDSERESSRCHTCGSDIPEAGICCPFCGAGRSAPRDEYCTACGTRVPAFGAFCPTCGVVKASLRLDPSGRGGAPPEYWARRSVEQMYARPPTPWRRLIKTGIAYGMVPFLAYMILALAALVVGMDIVIPELADRSFDLYIVTPFFVDIGSLSGDYLVAYYVVLVAVIIASAAWLYFTGGRGFVDELRMKGTSRKHSVLYELCGLMFAVLFLNAAIVFAMGLFGSEPTAPAEDAETWELLFLLANASVWEEIIVRVLMIGVPMIIVDLARNSLKAKKSRYVLGGGFTFGIPETVLIIVSSSIFGLAHYDAWGAWKIFPTAIAGLAFGYLFLKHGLPAAIMLHFAFDYLTMPIEVFESLSSLSALVLLGLAVLLWMALGAVLFGYYIVRAIEFLTGRQFLDYEEVASEPPPRLYVTVPQGGPNARRRPPPQQEPNVTFPTGPVRPLFVCPSCGHTEARWINREFICTRCGKSR